MALKLAGEVGDGFILQLADVDIAAWMIKTVRDAAAAAGRDPDALAFCVAAPMYIGDDWRAHARPVPLVRRDGRQPRRRHRGEVRRPRRDPGRADRLHQGPPGLRLQHARPRGERPRRLRARRDRRPVLRARHGGASTSPSSSSCARSASTQFAGYLQHDNKEETMRVYGETVIPALSRARDGQGMSASRVRQSRARPRAHGVVAARRARGRRTRRSAPTPGVIGRRSHRAVPERRDIAMPHIWDMIARACSNPSRGAPGRRRCGSRHCRPPGSASPIAAVGWVIGVAGGVRHRGDHAALPARPSPRCCPGSCSARRCR